MTAGKRPGDRLSPDYHNDRLPMLALTWEFEEFYVLPLNHETIRAKRSKALFRHLRFNLFHVSG